METLAVVLEAPERLIVDRIDLTQPGEGDVVVDVSWSGISTGTERLLWSGRMPPFPGMGYPLVPGYESVGRIEFAGTTSGGRVGQSVFVPGARCFGDIKGLFGGAAKRLVVSGQRVIPIHEDLAEEGTLLALAATARHAIAIAGQTPDLIIGHGVLGRLIARLAVLEGGSPTVWESNDQRTAGGTGYRVMAPEHDDRRDYACIIDVSGDAMIIDQLVARLAPRGLIVLAGFYSDRVSFAFPAAFMREASIRIAAEWSRDDLVAVNELAASGRLSFRDLITHRHDAMHAEAAYRTAFGDPACLKMILDWRNAQ
ncbi:MAG TPA: chlorophyll synthesis pathway protein BchC [Saliniramus sp.]|nr:chlorophyll synthesis pathway protein BchC [Saliniramus sp.]